MITNLFVAYLIATNVFAVNKSETERSDTLYRTIVYSMVVEGETITATNRTEIGRRCMQLQAHFIDAGSGLFRKETNWVEVPCPQRSTMLPPMPPPPPLPGGVMTNVPSFPGGYLIITNNTILLNGPRIPP